MRLRDAANLGAQLATKLISVPFALFMTGWAAHKLTSGDLYILLSAANYLPLLGLLQFALPNFIMREVAHAWARDGVVQDLPEVRGAFVALTAIAALGVLIILAALHSGKLPGPLAPLFILVLLACPLSIGDQVRLATGESSKSSAILLAFYPVCALLMLAATSGQTRIPGLAIVAAFGSVYLANIVSFLGLLRKRFFRELLSPVGPVHFKRPFIMAAPMLLGQLGTSILLNVPVAGQFLPILPKISIDSLACLRLFSSGVNAFHFVMQPLGPVLLGYFYSENSRFRSSGAAVILGLLATSLLGGVFFAAFGPGFIHLWLDGLNVTRTVAAKWGGIAALWMTLMTLVFVSQITSRVLMGNLACVLAAGAAVLVGIFMPLNGPEVMMLTGLSLGVILGLVTLALVFRDSAKVISPLR